MEAMVEEKIGYLESVLGQFIVSTNTGLNRLEQNIATLSNEMQDFKDEMNVFKNNSEKERKNMNKKWGELANKMGTIVEDIVAPAIGGIARKHFQVDVFDFFAIRLKTKNFNKSSIREFDVIATTDKFFFIVETKASPRTEYIQKFIELIPDLETWFPESKNKKLIPIFASLYIPEDAVKYLTNNNIFAIAMKDDSMDILNSQLLITS